MVEYMLCFIYLYKRLSLLFFTLKFRLQNQSSFSSLSVIVYVNLFLAISSLSRYSS